MKRVVLTLLLLTGSLCFAEKLKTGDFCNISLDENFKEADYIRGIYPLFSEKNARGYFNYYVVEHNNYKYIIEKGTELYIMIPDEIGFLREIRKVKVEDIRPNYFIYSEDD